MVNYNDTKIYYIKVGDDLYYGHTAEKYLSTRQNRHKSSFRDPRCKQMLYEKMREQSMNASDILCVLVEDYPCNSVNEAKARERYWIENYGTLNMNIPGRSNKECWVEWYKHNRLKMCEYQAEFRKNNPEIVKEYQDKYREEHRDELRDYFKNKRDKVKKAESDKRYCENNREVLKEKSKDYYQKNKERLLEKQKQYAIVNKEKIAEYQSEYRKNQMKKEKN